MQSDVASSRRSTPNQIVSTTPPIAPSRQSHTPPVGGPPAVAPTPTAPVVDDDIEQTLARIRQRQELGNPTDGSDLVAAAEGKVDDFRQHVAFRALIPPIAGELLARTFKFEEQIRQYLTTTFTQTCHAESFHMAVPLKDMRARRQLSLRFLETADAALNEALMNESYAIRDRQSTLRPEGYQEHTFPLGDIYHGEWKNATLHGHGKWFSPVRTGSPASSSSAASTSRGVDGGTSSATVASSLPPTAQGGGGAAQLEYQGGWFLGLRNGTGTMKCLNTKITYAGPWSDGRRHGRGEQVEPSGIYRGEFASNVISGQGEYVFPDGKIYKGHWVNELFDGQGTLTCPVGGEGGGGAGIGLRYEGSWLGGMRHGKGTLEYRHRGERYVGEWLKDKRAGHGAHHTRDTVYVGEWKRDVREGEGWLSVTPGGSGTDHDSGHNAAVAVETYSGAFLDGRPSGLGTWEYRQGQQKYYGEWKDGLRHGRGRHTISQDGGTSEASSYDGLWNKGQRHGKGTLTVAAVGRLDIHWEKDAAHGDGIFTYLTSAGLRVVFPPGGNAAANIDPAVESPAAAARKGDPPTHNNNMTPSVSADGSVRSMSQSARTTIETPTGSPKHASAAGIEGTQPPPPPAVHSVVPPLDAAKVRFQHGRCVWLERQDTVKVAQLALLSTMPSSSTPSDSRMGT